MALGPRLPRARRLPRPLPRRRARGRRAGQLAHPDRRRLARPTRRAARRDVAQRATGLRRSNRPGRPAKAGRHRLRREQRAAAARRWPGLRRARLRGPGRPPALSARCRQHQRHLGARAVDPGAGAAGGRALPGGRLRLLGERQPGGRRGAGLVVRGDRRAARADAPAVRAHPGRRALEGLRAHQRRDRERQGSRGSGHPQAERASGWAVRPRQLRRACAPAHRIAALRAREGRFHRRRHGPRRRGRRRRRGHHLPRRDRRVAPRDADQAPAHRRASAKSFPSALRSPSTSTCASSPGATATCKPWSASGPSARTCSTASTF